MRKIDTIAADMIPIRLIISLAVVASISMLVGFGFLNLKISNSEDDVECQMNNIQSKMYNMIASGIARDVDEVDASDGTKRRITLSLPDNLAFIGFGVDPDENNDGVLKSGLTDQGNVIFYKIHGGSKKVIWFENKIRFREGKINGDKWVLNNPPQGFIISKGETTIVFELVERFNEKYILIQCNDGIG